MRLNHSYAIHASRSMLFCLMTGLAFASAQAQTAIGPQVEHHSAAEQNVAPGQGLKSQANSPDRTVGPQVDGSIVASNNQTLTPAGRIVELGTPVRAKQVVLNPNGVTHSGAVLLMGSPEPVIVFDTVSGQVLQRLTLTDASGASPKGINAGSYAGIAYSADGGRLLFSQDNNHVVIAKVDRKTGLLAQEQVIDLPAPPEGPHYRKGKDLINPGGIAITADGSRACVVLNIANAVGIIDLTASPARLVAQVPVGNAPNNVVIAGNYAYVSNEGGRPATSADFTNESDGTPIVVDRQDAFAITGTISVVDLIRGKEVKTIPVGLHPVGMTIAGNNLYVANAYSDSLSIVDLKTDAVTRTIGLRVPIAGGAFGAGPNDVAVTEDGRAYVTLGQANAVAVINLLGRDPNPVIGYIPTAYFPTSITYDRAQRQLVVADDKGLGSRGSAIMKHGATGYNTHADMGVVNLIPEPNAKDLARLSRQVVENNHWNLNTNIEVGKEYIDPHAAPVAVPRHIGEPSLIKHVFLIVKENRTYDGMLGDVTWGNGAPELAVFAAAVPNQHAFVKRFPLLDNVYAPSRQSADGHPWIVMSGSFYPNDIQAPDWMRSYGVDAMVNTPRGFLWTAAEAAGLTVKIYGEWSTETKIAKKADGSAYSWMDFYNTALCKEGKAPTASCVVPDDAVSVESSIPSAAKVLDPHYPPFNLGIPDQYRMDYWIPEFEKQVAADAVPNLTILWLPNDHTAGAAKGLPAPANYQADNDLALGRMVEAISHSKVWAQSAIFVEEDDSQDGADHVDGHRQPIYVISPYTVVPQAPGQGKAIHTTYTAENINRTIENILGMQPLTQFDLVASPMFDAFQNTPDLTPYNHLAAVLPLDHGIDLPSSNAAALNSMQKAWMKANAEVMKGKYDKADAVDPNFLNHSIWYATTGWTRPYPGEDKVLLPGSFVKAARKYHDDDDD